MRSGVIVRKLGMSREFQANGRHVPVTVLHLDGCRVVACKTEEQHGYTAVQVGVGSMRAGKVSKPLGGQFAKAGVIPRRRLAEFRVAPENLVAVGREILANHFVVGQYVDAQGVGIGKGFAGVMKRHHFRGGRASHGVSVSHRAAGSTGQHQEPGKVFKGKKMAGHMGAKLRTVQNLQIVRTDAERGLILVRGGIPGPKGGWVMLCDACKRPLPEEAPRPAGLRETPDPEMEMLLVETSVDKENMYDAEDTEGDVNSQTEEKETGKDAAAEEKGETKK